MIVVGLDGKEHKLNYAKYKSRSNRDNKSNLHKECLELLESMLKGYTIYEEITLPGANKLYADFFVPDLSLIIEVHGQQHYEYTPFFHKSKADFYIGKKRDKDKIEFCRLNNLSIAVLPYNEKEKWNQIIVQSMKG